MALPRVVVVVVRLLYSGGSVCWKKPGALPSCGKWPVETVGSGRGVPGHPKRLGWVEGGCRLTSILRLDGDDPFPLGPEAVGGLGLHLELVGHVLAEPRNSQPAFGGVAVHHKRGGRVWKGNKATEHLWVLAMPPGPPVTALSIALAMPHGPAALDPPTYTLATPPV